MAYLTAAPFFSVVAMGKGLPQWFYGELPWYKHVRPHKTTKCMIMMSRIKQHPLTFQIRSCATRVRHFKSVPVPSLHVYSICCCNGGSVPSHKVCVRLR
jgi:hypothetical protein